MDFGQKGYIDSYQARCPMHGDLVHIAKFIVKLKHSYPDFRNGLGRLVRQAYDEVIDMPRTRRWSLEELSSTEKTYVGTKVEILVQNWLGLERGKKLDLSIAGYEVDIKNTVRSSWMIPIEAVGEICLLIKGSEKKSSFSVGLVRANDEYLNNGRNRDRKRTISSKHYDKILWLALDGSLPKNFFYDLDSATRTAIFAPNNGSARVSALFRENLLTAIPRSAIEGVANQKDALKRVRKNGGARESLLSENILILSGKYDADLISELSLPILTKEEFISVPRDYAALNIGRARCEELFENT